MDGSFLEEETGGRAEVMCWEELGGAVAQSRGEGLAVKKCCDKSSHVRDRKLLEQHKNI